MKKRKIISIHNHPNNTYSAPSPANFEILKHEFEDYEIICSEKEYWIIIANGRYEKAFIDKFKEQIELIFKSCDSYSVLNSKKANSMYSTNLRQFINKKIKKISIINKEYRKMTEKDTSEWTLSTRDGGHEFSKRRAKQNWETYQNGTEADKKQLKMKIDELFGHDEKLKKELFPTLF